MKRLIILIILLMSTYLWAKDPVKVLYVVDGDTIVVMYQGKKEKIRLIGVDTPEIHQGSHLNQQVKQWKQSEKKLIRAGKKAKYALKNKLKKARYVYVKFDKQKRDPYGRLLAYMYADKDMINAWIIREKLGRPLWVKPNVRYRDRVMRGEVNKLRRKKGYNIPEGINNYGMKVVKKTELENGAEHFV